MGKSSKNEANAPHQTSISTYFAAPTSISSSTAPKRSIVEVLTLSESDDDGQDLPAPIKKPKLEPTPTPSDSRPTPTLAPQQRPSPAHRSSSNKEQAAARVSKWRFQHDSSNPSLPPSQAELARREAMAKRLLSQGSRILNRKSAYLQKEHYLSAGLTGEGDSREGSTSWGGEDEDEAEGEMAEDDDGDMEDDEPVGKGKSKGKGKEVENRFARFASSSSRLKAKNGKGKEVEGEVKYTPLEKQVIALKKANPGVVLMVEVGYKYRFFEEDAQIASRTLGIACFPLQHMLTASVPTHRLNIHLKRLINNGYKVGIVTQTETAALKKTGDNKSGPFTRAVTSIYTSATYIDELSMDPIENTSSGSTSSNSTLLCLVEEANDKDEKVRLGLVAVMPSTGEVVYDDFEDGLMRSELETRMLHLQPSELVLQKEMTRQTESMVSYLLGHGAGSEGISCRVERIPKRLKAENAYTFLSDFYAKSKSKAGPEGKNGDGGGVIVIDDEDEEDAEVKKILDLPSNALIALSALIKYLKAFSLDSVFLHTHSFSHFSNRSVMSLQGNTLANLEVLRKNTDFKEKGSLISVIDHCRTAFGKRLLRKWVAKPLLSRRVINERLDAITEINQNTGSLPIVRLREVLRGLPDLERGLVRIYFGKATPYELLRVLQAFQRIGSVFEEVDEEAEADGARTAHSLVKSVVLKKIVKSLPGIKSTAEGFLGEIDAGMARQGNKEDLFFDGEMFEELQEAKNCLAAAECEIQQELSTARKVLKLPSLQFISVAQVEYLIEVRIAQAKKLVPDDWIRINATKFVHRYRTPTVQKKLLELEAARETVAAEADKAFKKYLQRVSKSYEAFREVVGNVATVDCLYSLAVVALSPGYTRPELVVEAGVLEIVAGRHPMVEVIMSDPFVPNDVEFGNGRPKQMVLTGLNMGGKSSLSRSIALIALLAQIGSYVPAESCRTSLFDGIYTRMGATDDLARGRSTFLVELSETSEILKMATPRSLIILDELGRGTSTMDGQAIASAVLQYIVTHVQAITIFITHYPQLAEIIKRHPESVRVAHMACLEKARSDGFADVVFLYKLAEGLASRSHGLNVARLADLPESVLVKALQKAQELEKVVEDRMLAKKQQTYSSLMQALLGGRTSNKEEQTETLNQAREVVMGL